MNLFNQSSIDFSSPQELLSSISTIDGFNIIVYILLFIFTINYVNNNIPNVLKEPFARLHFYLFKKSKAKKILKEIIEEVSKETDEDDLLDNKIDFVKTKELDEKDDFGIIFIKDSDTIDSIKGKLLIQIPSQYLYSQEKMVLNEPYKDAFEKLLIAEISNKNNRYDILSNVDSYIQEKKLVKEYDILSEIYNNSEKFKLFIDEARRRSNESKTPLINQTSKNEFEKFIVDLSTGLFQVVRISHKSFNFYSERIISKLLNQKTKGIYVFARGDEFVEKLDIVKDSLNSSIIKDIEITDNGAYTWKNKNKKTKAKTLIVKIKR